jgi:hypothetical protein
MSMHPIFTIHRRASSSFTSGTRICRRFRGVSRVDTTKGRVGIQSGMWLGASFWKKWLPSQPSG